MHAQASQDLNAFIDALRDGDLFARAGRSFALLAPGDWQGLQRWAESFGYAFTLPELYGWCRDYPHTLGQLSDSPHLSGWSLESLRLAAQA
jgi:hypothetical protein